MNTPDEWSTSDHPAVSSDMRGSDPIRSTESLQVDRSDGRIYWRRILAEALAIVASILLAFAIDAWWERRSLAREEDTILQGLLADFESTTAHASAVRASSQELVEVATEILRATGPTSTIPPDSASRLVGKMIAVGVPFFPIEGTLSSLFASDGLGRISNPVLRAKLAAWPQYVAAVHLPEARRAAFLDNQLMPYLHIRVPVRTLDMFADPSLPSGDSRFPVDINSLMTDPHFENLVSDLLFATVTITSRLARLEAAMSAILFDLRATESSALSVP